MADAVHPSESLKTYDSRPTKNASAQSISSGGRRKKESNLVYVSRTVVDNKYFVAFTTCLTIWALSGDDVRMFFTNIAFDPIYNVIVCLMLFVFTVEVVLSCIGKDDYFPSFFFVLDVVSTATLILDVTPIADTLSGVSDEDGNTKEMRGGRTAKLGAKAGRILRVLRLVRILKLYKAYYEAKMRAKAREERLKRGDVGDDDDDWDDSDIEQGNEDEPGKAPQTESRVGKKLSEMTTRRVICLILAMLLVLPFLQVDLYKPFSRDYGADYILDTFGHYMKDVTSKEEYEKSVLQYAYYHNWFAGKTDWCKDRKLSCADDFYGHLFWVGIMGESVESVLNYTEKAQLSKEVVYEFNEAASKQDYIYNYGVMPKEAQDILASPWTTNCDSTSGLIRRGISLLSSDIGGIVKHKAPCPEDLRKAERDLVFPRSISPEDHKQWNFMFCFDKRGFTQQSALWSFLTTVFVLCLLVFGSLMFSSDANRLVVNPVEKMIKRVELIRENPLIAMRMADEEFKAEEVAKARLKRMRKERLRLMATGLLTCEMCNPKGGNEPMETVILEKTIIKLGSLLALGFGEAGANIIGQNMKGSDSAGVNAMVPGTRVDCIIGVARVRDFSTATEVLQTRIMTFVNQIAEIVHGVVNEYHGAPNKNNGDSFLIIWRLVGGSDSAIGSVDDRTSRIAEMSLVAFANVLGALNRSVILAAYRGHPGLQMRLRENCRVNLSFGLHLGWAIEGAVGSEFKIDASYLSPNVSIATSVERATAVFDVSIIVSQSVVEKCRPSMRMLLRLVERHR
eukprot:TRINITY_DN12881_c0_g1_i2.p1 TRINITY_DN12881_c0_g1~~TRINITY_DN12881_c0_g1_i2.p1  ORF type:complete len:814 (+),score=178.06 TRINITY_DN12881_c0_g1_i2:68-2443(+)